MKGLNSATVMGLRPAQARAWLVAAARSGAVSTSVPSRSNTMVASFSCISGAREVKRPRDGNAIGLFRACHLASARQRTLARGPMQAYTMVPQPFWARSAGASGGNGAAFMDKPTISLIRSKCYVDGQWIGEGKLPVTNKATGDLITRVPEFGESETRRAIEAADRALPSWSKLLAKDRSKLIRAWHNLIVEHADELALLLTSEQGKPLAEAKGEILYAAGFIEFFAEEAKRVYGETITTFKADARVVGIKQPVGVVAAITPWNFPAAMITRKAGPALAVGCTMVLKPASETPLTALALAELAERAGLPKGVFNVITGKASVIGKELTSNPTVRMLTFTGSTEIGRTLMAQCAPTIKKLGLELGGNAPFIVFDDADLDKAVAGAMASKYRNAGQTCVCANRIYVQDKVYDSFAQKLAAEVKKMKV